MQDLISVYIHWPFCKSKCPYCDFNSYTNSKIDEEEFVNTYLKELEHYGQKLKNRKISTIFFGGGTPSLMCIKSLEKILNKISELWQVDKNTEISLEANPITFEIEKFKDFKNAGINRLSIGIQALNDADLKLLGRIHDFKQAFDSIKIAQKIFKDSYSIDLIYTRPKQTLEDWKKELEQAIELSPYHLSLYQLSLEPGTQFYKKYKNIDQELSAKFYELTQEITEKNNIGFYEVSNYARKNYECKHNLNYWKYGEYIGIGAGAHGRIEFQQNKRTVVENIKNPIKWMEKVNKFGCGFEEKYVLNSEEKFKEFVLMGLRLRNGIQQENIYDLFDLKKLKYLEKQNLIEVCKNRIKVKKDKFILLDSITTYLL